MAVFSNTSGDALVDVIARAAAGDKDAFAAIMAAHEVDMAKVAYVICGDLDLADEALQSAWLLAWRKVGTVRDAARLRPWLVTVVANEARQVLRRRRRRSVIEIPLDEAGQSIAPDPAGRATDVDLAMALAKLSPEDRSLLALRYVAGLDSTELGHATGRSASGTRARLARLLAGLRSELGDD